MTALFALLLIGQTVAPEPSSGGQSEDVVVRYLRKLEDWRAVLVFQHRKKPECRVVTSTDDAGIDDVGCRTMVQCFVTTEPQFLALNNRALTPRQRRQMRSAANRAMADCFKVNRRAMMIELTNRRDAQLPITPEK